jgi:cell division protein FtsL
MALKRTFSITNIVLSIFVVTICIMLFRVSQDVRDAEKKLRKIDSAIATERETMRVLNAEWSYLTRPERIEELAHKYLDMERPPVKDILLHVSELPYPVEESPIATVSLTDSSKQVKVLADSNELPSLDMMESETSASPLSVDENNNVAQMDGTYKAPMPSSLSAASQKTSSSSSSSSSSSRSDSGAKIIKPRPDSQSFDELLNNIQKQAYGAP